MLPPADVQIKIVEDFKALDTQLDSHEKNIQQLDADMIFLAPVEAASNGVLQTDAITKPVA